VAVVRKQDGSVVCGRCLVADSVWLRMKGLLGRAGLAEDEGLLLRPASSIHMFFMRFAIDAVFLDRELSVLKIAPHLGPWRMASKWGARSVLELPAGSTERAGLREGDRLTLD
jgi:uncharacterized membrane protein (UPF0127 family)